MKKILLSLVIGIIVVFVSIPAMAACSSYPYTLTNGNPANADEVMHNFGCAALLTGSTMDSTTFTGTTTLSGPVTGAGISNYLASPPPIGGTTPASVSATTFTSSSMAKVFLTNSSAQSVPNSTTTAITGWTAGRDATSMCNLSTGVCTAAAAADYLITEHVTLNGTMPVPTGYQCPIAVNGVQVADDIRWVTNAGQNINSCDSQALVHVSAGQSIVAQIFQNSGSTLSLHSSSILNYLIIEQLP